MKTVAAVSFRNDHSISMDVEDVTSIEMGAPMEAGDGNWFCELIIRSSHGFVAMQLLADDPARFRVRSEGGDAE